MVKLRWLTIFSVFAMKGLNKTFLYIVFNITINATLVHVVCEVNSNNLRKELVFEFSNCIP